MHFTGKGSGERAASACKSRRILIATEPVKDFADNPPCLLFDPVSLRRTGAIAIRFDRSRPEITSTAMTTRPMQSYRAGQ